MYSSLGIQLANRENVILRFVRLLRDARRVSGGASSGSTSCRHRRAVIGEVALIVVRHCSGYLCIGLALNSWSVTSASQVMPPRLTLNCVPPSLGEAPCQWTTPGGQ